MTKQLTQAEIKQRQDAEQLLAVAIADREEYVKVAHRLENNLRVFVERSNYELASLARTIAQKDENIATLKKMVDGYFVEPTAPTISQDSNEKPPAQEKANGAAPNPAKASSDSEATP